MADQPNALFDSPVPAGAQQNAEQTQNLPQELEPIADQAPAPGPADEVNLFFLVRFEELVLLRFCFLFFFSCLAW